MSKLRYITFSNVMKFSFIFVKISTHHFQLKCAKRLLMTTGLITHFLQHTHTHTHTPHTCSLTHPHTHIPTSPTHPPPHTKQKNKNKIKQKQTKKRTKPQVQLIGKTATTARATVWTRKITFFSLNQRSIKSFINITLYKRIFVK